MSDEPVEVQTGAPRFTFGWCSGSTMEQDEAELNVIAAFIMERLDGFDPYVEGGLREPVEPCVWRDSTVRGTMDQNDRLVVAVEAARKLVSFDGLPRVGMPCQDCGVYWADPPEDTRHLTGCLVGELASALEDLDA